VSCSGDGTVPYWSLQHAQEWAGQCDVIVDAKNDGANHRKILTDERFHAVVLNYTTNLESSAVEHEFDSTDNIL
jgi:hypothetical protein